MGWGKRWAELLQRRRIHRQRARKIFQTCRHCRRYLMLPISQELPICDRCRNQH